MRMWRYFIHPIIGSTLNESFIEEFKLFYSQNGSPMIVFFLKLGKLQHCVNIVQRSLLTLKTFIFCLLLLLSSSTSLIFQRKLTLVLFGCRLCTWHTNLAVFPGSRVTLSSGTTNLRVPKMFCLYYIKNLYFFKLNRL